MSDGECIVGKSAPRGMKRARSEPPPRYDLGLDSVLRTGGSRTPDRRVLGNAFGALAAPRPSTHINPVSPPDRSALEKRRRTAAQLPHPCLVRLSSQANSPLRGDFLLLSTPSKCNDRTANLDLFPFVAVAGCAELIVLRGAVSVLGHRITHSSGPLPLYSAPLGSFLSVLEPVKSLPNENELSLDPVAQAVLDQHPALSEVVHAVIRFLSLEKSKTPCLSVVSNLPLPITRLLDGPIIVSGLFIPFVDTKYSPFQRWEAWPDVLSSLDKAAAHSLRVLTRGEHGSGKSMVARCVVNHLLNSFDAVLFVDTDVGQPEVVPPGMISATIVSRPLLGPPASHNSAVPLLSSFVGEVTPREQLTDYSVALAAVIASARRYAETNGLPLVINSDGWLSGAGAELHEKLLRMADPSHVFASCFSGTEPEAQASKNAVSRTPSSLRSAGFASYQLVVLQAPHSGQITTPVVPASMMRDLSLSCYLSNSPVRSICLTDMNLSFLGEGISASHVLAALRSMTVAIAVTDGSPSPISWRVLGLGLVRAVDPERHTLFVASPIPDEDVKLCDGLIISRGVTSPSNVIQLRDEKCISHRTPYVVQRILAGTGAMKSRSNLHRH